MTRKDRLSRKEVSFFHDNGYLIIPAPNQEKKLVYDANNLKLIEEII